MLNVFDENKQPMLFEVYQEEVFKKDESAEEGGEEEGGEEGGEEEETAVNEMKATTSNTLKIPPIQQRSLGRKGKPLRQISLDKIVERRRSSSNIEGSQSTSRKH